MNVADTVVRSRSKTRYLLKRMRFLLSPSIVDV